jgi:hypothetical protein
MVRLSLAQIHMFLHEKPAGQKFAAIFYFSFFRKPSSRTAFSVSPSEGNSKGHVTADHNHRHLEISEKRSAFGDAFGPAHI